METVKTKINQVDQELDIKLNQLYEEAFESQYITVEALEGNDRIHFFDVEDEIDYRIQLNHVRSKYSKSMAGKSKPPLPKGALCPICIENVGSEGKENLKHLPIELEGEPFFLQLTPFPLYHHHFVLISEAHRPMEVSLNSFQKQLTFLDRMPNYTVCSNSDREGAGASILSHLHYQVFKSLRLPIFDTKPIIEKQLGDVSYTLCKYPMTVIKICTKSRFQLEVSLSRVLELWRKETTENTCNTVLRIHEGQYEAYLVLRNAAFNTPSKLLKYKYEGIGVIEACGEGILPTPEGDEASQINKDIREEGKAILKGILKSINPLNSEDALSFFDEIVS
ncbi:DUF4922 domain-containing protein [Flammeovirga sp. SubArs3]|uniref:DUF4922 domain-containing protein n=1 Tax=Flammeovirga sp. SubArs3 TaxID=2995316 RepID=UPI00248D08CD|nr:DUF4922 domain-containing protein [Flammeovirga sp. SubArs3]